MGKNHHQGHRQRVRERIIQDPDFSTFQPHEILEYVLFWATPLKDTNEIAHELIDHFGALDAVFNATPDQLFKIKGVTKASAFVISSILPIARVVNSSAIKRRSVKIETIRDFVELMRPSFEGRQNEVVFSAYLDGGNRVIKLEKIMDGSANSVYIDCQRVAVTASQINAVSVLIAHNHPGGRCVPSFDDIVITEKLATTLAALNITLIEHLIFADDKYFSFAKAGLTQKILGSSIRGAERLQEKLGSIPFEHLATLARTANELKTSLTQLYLQAQREYAKDNPDFRPDIIEE